MKGLFVFNKNVSYDSISRSLGGAVGRAMAGIMGGSELKHSSVNLVSPVNVESFS